MAINALEMLGRMKKRVERRTYLQIRRPSPELGLMVRCEVTVAAAFASHATDWSVSEGNLLG